MKLRKNIKTFILMLPVTTIINTIIIATFFNGFDKSRVENWLILTYIIMYNYAQMLILFKLKGKGEK